MEQGGTYDILIPQGFTWREVFTYTEDDGTTPIDLTGWEGRGQVRKRRSREAELLAEIEIEIDGPAGDVTATLHAVVTDEMSSSGFYDIKLTDGDDDDEGIRLVQGRARLSNGVTE